MSNNNVAKNDNPRTYLYGDAVNMLDLVPANVLSEYIHIMTKGEYHIDEMYLARGIVTSSIMRQYDGWSADNELTLLVMLWWLGGICNEDTVL